jgi:hypothetical protein
MELGCSPITGEGSSTETNVAANLSMFLIKHRTTKTYKKWRYASTHVCTKLRSNISFTLCQLFLLETYPGTLCDLSGRGPSPRLETVEKTFSSSKNMRNLAIVQCVACLLYWLKYPCSQREEDYFCMCDYLLTALYQLEFLEAFLLSSLHNSLRCPPSKQLNNIYCRLKMRRK